MYEGTMSRREALKRGVAGAAVLSAGSLLNAGRAFGSSSALETVRWISPRGTLQVMDDFNLWVPLKMGYFGVMTLVQHLQGKPVEKRVDTGVSLITKENMTQPDMAALLAPPIAKYLKE